MEDFILDERTFVLVPLCLVSAISTGFAHGKLLVESVWHALRPTISVSC